MHTLINVAGIARSGGTLVHLMLGNAPNAFACGEVMNHFRSFMKDHEDPDCVCGDTPCPVWTTMEGVSEHQFVKEACDRLDVDFVIDSSRAASWLLDTRRWNPPSSCQVTNLFVWKDPLELAFSFWKRGHDPMFWRGLFVKYYDRVVRVGLPILAVNFGDVMRDPSTKLAELCSAVGMPYFDGKERFWEKQHHLLFANDGVRRQLGGGQSSLQSSITFSPEFESHVARIRDEIARDQQVQDLVARLQQADVSHASAAPQSFSAPRPYPLWYRAHQAKQIVHRTFRLQLVSSEPTDVATNPTLTGPADS